MSQTLRQTKLRALVTSLVNGMFDIKLLSVRDEAWLFTSIFSS
jgi:hypothetical protein